LIGTDAVDSKKLTLGLFQVMKRSLRHLSGKDKDVSGSNDQNDNTHAGADEFVLSLQNLLAHTNTTMLLLVDGTDCLPRHQSALFLTYLDRLARRPAYLTEPPAIATPFMHEVIDRLASFS
tara:strand:+ start:384 stop:746 length:363 start_codon:yes stop_codon:yes gene_type:complete